MAPRNAKVWNEDLCKAMQIRQEQCQILGKQQQYMWRDGWREIQQIRNDIYKFSTGRIVNLPTTKLNKTVLKLCEDIINEKESIIPTGYLQTNVDNLDQSVNPFDNDPYLKKIKLRGGAYAILMAFHNSTTTTMTKSEIVRDGQQYCDDEMESNWNAGRIYGAFDAKKTLIRHGLITQNSMARTTGGNSRTRNDGSLNTFTLTREGEKFIEAMLRKFPTQVAATTKMWRENHSNKDNMECKTCITPTSSPEKQPKDRKAKATATKRSHGMMQDELNLRKWVASAKIGDQNVFHVDKERCEYLRLLCDSLQSENHELYLKLSPIPQESVSNHRNHLTIMVIGPPSLPRTKNQIEVSKSKESSTAKRSLLVIPNPYIKKSTTLPNNINFSPSKRNCSGGQNSKSNGRPASAKRSLFPPPAVASTTIEILSSDSESDDDDDNSAILPSRRPHHRNKEVIEIDEEDFEEGVVKVVSSKLNTKSQPGQELTILIDSRERNRNCTPRYLRIQLEQNLNSGLLNMVWPNHLLPVANAEERRLSHGDFAFEIGTKDDSSRSRLDVLVERKRVSDLVQRSKSGDHWKQLAAMRECCRHNFLLVENDTTSASSFTAFTTDENDDDASKFDPFDTVIEDEDGIFRLYWHLLLLSTNHSEVKFIQTRDEQSSLRAIGSIGLMATTSGELLSKEDATVEAPISPSDDQASLLARLKKGGVPWSLAKRVAMEIGSISLLDRLYKLCESDECRSALLASLLSDFGLLENGMKSTAHRWSHAIFKVFTSNTEKVAVKSRAMEEHKHLINDHGLFLDLLHTYESPEEALDAALRNSTTCRTPPARIVTVTLSQPNLKEFFPGFETTALKDSSTFRFRVQHKSQAVPTITTQTTQGGLSSCLVFVYIQEAKEFVGTILNHMNNAFLTGDFTTGAKDVASFLVRNQYNHCNTTSLGTDKKVILIQGLQAALDANAKKAGARAELRVIVDLVIAEITLFHDFVVLQATKTSNMLRQLLFSCLHYHLLIYDDSKILHERKILKEDRTKCEVVCFSDDSDDDSLPGPVFTKK